MTRKALNIISLFVAAVAVETAIVAQPVGASGQIVAPACVKVVKRAEMEELIRETKSTDPKAINSLIFEVKRLFGLSCQAIREGLANDAEMIRSLKYTSIGLTAAEFDDLKRKSAPGTEPYSWVTADQIAAFYANPQNAAEFATYFSLTMNGAPNSDAAAELRARDSYARILIAYADAKENGAKLDPKFNERVDSIVKFQESQALAEKYLRSKVMPKVEVTDAQIDLALKTNREFSTTAKRLKANGVLKRVLAGEDFAKLALQYSEDPGSKAQGGLYTDIAKDVFEQRFQSAALSVKPGETVKTIVETPFGFHIIRLEKLTEENGVFKSFDVRHILFSTMVGTGENRTPLREFVRGKLEDKRRDAAIAAILIKNPVTIEYKVPIVRTTTKPARKSPAKRTG